ncbi:hypothetical protein D3C72_2601780 [compost metagenome]
MTIQSGLRAITSSQLPSIQLLPRSSKIFVPPAASIIAWGVAKRPVVTGILVPLS